LYRAAANHGVSCRLAFALIATLVCVTFVTASGAAAPSAGASLPSDSSPSSAGAAVDFHPSRPSADSPAAPGIVAVYPDPVADGDRGEFVVLRLPERANRSAWTLTEGDATVSLGNGTGGGRVAVAADPTIAREHADATVLTVPRLGLANAGERLTLRRNGTVVDELRYGDSEEGSLYVGGEWRPLGATDHPVTRHSVDEVRPFLLPDSPGVPATVLSGAERRLLLAGYTFESERATEHLVAAAERGVRVSVLLEAAPVGGRSRRAAALLDRLVAAGVDVRVLGGPRSRYAYHHPKYAVVDDRALVLTENWKPSGTGGRANRGWGVVVPDAGVAADLARVFERDAAAVDATSWEIYRAGRTFPAAGDPAANGTFPTGLPAETRSASAVELLVAPDNAEGRLRELLAGADDRILVQQMTVDGPDGPFVSTAVAAARRGVEVRILLSGAWYVREENRRLVEHLRRVADREDLPLAARVADPGDRYRQIHAKGVVIDGETAVVGSLNWNAESARDNREVLLVVNGSAAGYYERAFEADWAGGDGAGSGLPVRVLALAGVVAVACAVLVARRVAFEKPGGEERLQNWP
jgi:phosphatidylserine/phosphatidylglycerophosphate/cardiolipin synthase-like enzyme